MKDPFSVSGKVVVVTGGLGRLGRQFVRALIERGAKVAVLDALECPRNPGRYFRAKLTQKNFSFTRTDVTLKPSLEAALRSLKRAPQGLINAAALDSPPDSPAEANGPFEEYPAAEWERIMDINVKGVFLTCQVFGRAMAAAGGGSIININSIYGMVSPDQRIYEYRARKGGRFFKPAAYSASKSALFNLTRYLATYWAPRGVRVNSLTLGGLFDGQPAEFLKGYEARVPLGRMARAGEYNGAAIFLLSDAASYMTGSNLVIDGGWTAW